MLGKGRTWQRASRHGLALLLSLWPVLGLLLVPLVSARGVKPEPQMSGPLVPGPNLLQNTNGGNAASNAPVLWALELGFLVFVRVVPKSTVLAQIAASFKQALLLRFGRLQLDGA